MTIQVKINTANQTLRVIEIVPTQVITIEQPQEKVSFELLDLTTGLAPQSIVAKRVGSNLEIAFEEAETASLVINGYYNNEEVSPLVGLAEDGKYYTYIPVSGENADSIPNLKDNILAAEVLGGQTSSLVPFFATLPWIAGGLTAAVLDATLLSRDKGTLGLNGLIKPIIHAAQNGAVIVTPHKANVEQKIQFTAQATGAEQAVTLKKDPATGKWNATSTLPAGVTLDANTGVVVFAPESVKGNKPITATGTNKQGQTESNTQIVKVDPTETTTGENDNSSSVQPSSPVRPSQPTPPAPSTPTDTEQKLAQARADIEAAKRADQEAKDALERATADGNIDDAEREELERLKSDAEEKKAAAENSVNALPDDVAEKADLKEQLDQLTGIEIPAAPSTPTDTEQKLAQAKADIEAAKEADQKAKDALEKAKEDGIDDAERAELERLKADAEEKKAAAENSVNALPDDVAEKAELKEQLDQLTGIEIPAVPSPSVEDAQKLDQAKADIEAAKIADKEAKNALEEAKADGLISPDEQERLKEKQATAKAEKDKAEASVNALPDTVPEKADLKVELDNLDNIIIPPVNDADNDNKLDSEELAQAQTDVNAAKAAADAAKEALENAEKDGVISPEEHENLTNLKKAADDAKDKAQAAVDELPSSMPEKGELTNVLNDLESITIPEVTKPITKDDLVLKDYLDNEGIVEAASTKPVTNDTTPGFHVAVLDGYTPVLYKRVKGTTEAWEKVDAVYEGATAADSRSTLTPTQPLAEGHYEFSYALVKGNVESVKSDPLPLEIDTTKPTAPAFETEGNQINVTLPPEADAEKVVLAVPRKDQPVALIVIEKTQEGWNVIEGGNLLPEGVIQGDKVVIPTENISVGETIIGYSIDKAGNQSSEEPSDPITAPEPTSKPEDAPTSYRDDVAGGGFGDQVSPTEHPKTNDNTPGLNIGPNAANPRLYVDGNPLADSEFTYDPATGVLTPVTPLTEGEHELSYSVKEEGKTESKPSEPLRVIVDITPPEVPIQPVLTPENGTMKVMLPDNAEDGDRVVLSVPQEPKAGEENPEPKEVEFTKTPEGWVVSKGDDVVPAVQGNEAIIPADKVADNVPVTGKIIDEVGNEREIPAREAGGLPDTPSSPSPLLTYGDDQESVTGTHQKQPLTNDNTPSFNVEVPEGYTPKLYKKVAGSDDKWEEVEAEFNNTPNSQTLTPKQPLADGDYEFSYSLTAPGHIESKKSNALELGIDTQAPAAPEVKANPDGSVEVILPPTAEIGDVVEVMVQQPGQSEKTPVKVEKTADGWVSQRPDLVTVSPEGDKATIADENVEDGSEVKATTMDPAGNVSAETPTDRATALSKEKTSTPKPSSYRDDSGETPIPESNAEKTRDNTPGLNIGPNRTFEGKPTLLVDGEAVPATYDPETGTLTPNAPLADGRHELRYKATEPGKAESTSEPLILTVDTTPPEVEFETGKPAAGALTVILPPTAEDGDKVELSIPQPESTDAPKNVVFEKKDGTWKLKEDESSADSGIQFTPETGTVVIPADKVNDAKPVSAVSRDPLGNEATSSAVAGRLDPTQVTLTKPTYKDDEGTVTADESTAPTTDDTTPGLNIGENQPNPQLYVNDKPVESTYENGVLTPKTPLDPSDEPYKLTYTVTEEGKGESAPSPAVEVTVDRTAPTAPTVTAGNQPGSLTVGLPTDAKDGDTAELEVTPQDGGDPVKVVFTKNGDNWDVSSDDPSVVVPTDEPNTFTIPADKVSDTVPVAAVAKDPAGNSNTADNVPAAGELPPVGQPSLTEYVDNVPNGSTGGEEDPAQEEVKGTESITNDNTPAFKVTVADGEEPKLFKRAKGAADTAWEEVEAEFDGTPNAQTLTPKQPLEDGEYEFSYSLTKPDHRESPKSDPLLLTVDTQAPAPVTFEASQPSAGALTATLPANAKENDTVVLVITPQESTQTPYRVELKKTESGWQITSGNDPEVVTLEGDKVVIPEDKVNDAKPVAAYSVDEAGNVTLSSGVAGGLTETAPPSKPTYKDDVGDIQNDHSTAPTTDDTTPALNIGSGKSNPKLYVDGNLVDSTYNDQEGTLTPVKPLEQRETPYKLAYTLTESGKAESQKSPELTVIVDKTAPSVPSFTAKDGAMTVTLPMDAIVGDTVELTVPQDGEEPPKKVVFEKVGENQWNVVEGSDVVPTVTGRKAVIPADKVSDEQPITAITKDPAGNKRETTAPKAGTLPKTENVDPLENYLDNEGDNVPQSTAPVTNDKTPGFNIGAGKENEQPKLYQKAKGEDEWTEIDATYDNDLGTLTPNNPLADGEYEFSYSLTKPGHTESDKSAALPLEIDTHISPVVFEYPPMPGALMMSFPEDAKVGDTVELDITPQESTEDAVVVVFEKGENGWTIQSGNEANTVTLTEDGKVVIPADKVNDAKPVNAVSKDKAGNEISISAVAGRAEQTSQPPKVAYEDNVGDIQSPASTAATTDDTTPGLKIGENKPNPKLYVDHVLTPATYVNGVLTPETPLVEREKPYVLTYTLTEEGKDESPESPELSVVIDTTAPKKPVIEQGKPYQGALTVNLPDDAKDGDTVELMVAPEGSDVPEKVVLTKEGDNWKVTEGDPDMIQTTPGSNTAVIPADKVSDTVPVTAVSKDPAGNKNEAVPMAAGELAPTDTPVLVDYRDNQGEVRNNALGDQSKTDDTTPSLNIGTGKSNPKLYIDGKEVASYYDAQAGTLTPTKVLSDGDKPYTLSYSVKDENKAESKSNEITMILDTTAPEAPRLVKNQPYVGALTVELPTENVETGDMVELMVPPQDDNMAPVKVVLTKTPTGWDVTEGQDVVGEVNDNRVEIPAEKVSDTRPVTGLAKDSVGNSNNADPVNVGPLAKSERPRLDNYKDDQGSVTNDRYGHNTRSDDKTPSLNIGTDKSNPKLYIDGKFVESTYKNGLLTPVADALNSGDRSYRLSYSVTEPNKAESDRSNEIHLILDTTAPAAPTFRADHPYKGALTVNLPPRAEQGDTVELTIPAEPVNGVAQPDQTVVLTKQRNGWKVTQGADVVLAPQGNSVVIPANKVADNQDVTGVSKDPVGNVSQPNTGRVGPMAKTAKPPKLDNYRDDEGTVTNNHYGHNTRTDDTTPSLNIGTGKSNPKLYIDGKFVPSTYENGLLTPTTPINKDVNKTYGLSYTVTEPNKAESDRSNEIYMILDTRAPDAPTFTANQPYLGALTVNLPANAERGDTVELTIPAENGGQPQAVVLTKQNNSWTVTKGQGVVLAPQGNKVVIPANKVADNQEVIGISKDPVGNSSATNTGSVGGMAPTGKPATPTSYKDDVAPVVENQRTKAPTNDDKPGLNIGRDKAGKMPKLYVDGNFVEADYNPSEGTLTPRQPLSPGKHQLSYTLTEPNKLESPRSAELAVEIDKTAPSMPRVNAQTTDGSVRVEMPTDAKPTDKVVVKFMQTGQTNETTVTFTKQTDGTWKSDKPNLMASTQRGHRINSPVILEERVEDKTLVKAQAFDEAGNASREHSDRAKDVTPPKMPTLKAEANGSVTVGLPDNAKIGDLVTVNVVKTGQTTSTAITLTKTANGWSSSEPAVVPSVVGLNQTIIPENQVEDLSLVTAISRDPDNNGANRAPARATARDVTPPDVPTVKANADGSVTIGLPTNAKPTDTVTVKVVKTGEIQPTTVTLTKTATGWNSSHDDLVPSTNANSTKIAERLVEDLTDVRATSRDNSGNAKPGEGHDRAKDVTPPTPLTLVAEKDGSITVQLPIQDVKVNDTVTVNVVKTGENVATPVTLTKTATGWSIPDNMRDVISLVGDNTAKIAAKVVKDGSQVTARAEDPSGNVTDANTVLAANERVFEKLVLRLSDDTQGILRYADRDRRGKTITRTETVGSKTDKITSNDKVIVEKVPAGMDWQYSLDGGNTWTDMPAGTNSFNLTQNGERPNGRHYNVLARVKDAPSSLSNQLGVTIDKVKPVVSAFLEPGANGGRGAFKGTAEPGTFVVLKIGNNSSRTVIGKAVADSNGNFTINPPGGSGQPELSKAGTYTVEAIDKAGNKGHETFKSSYLELKTAYQGIAHSNNNQSTLDQINNNNSGNDYIHIHENNNAPEPKGVFATGNPRGAIWGQAERGPHINTGNGDDYIYVQKSIRQYANIEMGSGDDTLEVGDSIRRYGLGGTNKVQIDMGSGDDTVIVKGILGPEGGSASVVDASIYGGVKLEMGTGNDHLKMKGNITELANVRGGDGFDTISLIDSGAKLTAQTNSIFGWEKIDLTGTGRNTLVFERGTNGIIEFVQKNGGTVKDDNGQTHHKVLIITGNGDDRIENFNGIAQSGTVQYNGERYKVYSGIGGTHQLWIDYDIQIA